MNTLMPGAVRGSSALDRARGCRCWRPGRSRSCPRRGRCARRYLSSSAAASSVGGVVLGMSMKLVRPPATAAADSVAMSALYSRPGSRKCTWSSIMPGSRRRPRGIDHGLVAARASARCRSAAMRPSTMRRSPSNSRPSLTRRALTIRVVVSGMSGSCGGRSGRGGHGIVAARVQGMAAGDAAQREPAAARGAEAGDRPHRVFRAGRHEAAARAQQRADPALVAAQAADEQTIDHGFAMRHGAEVFARVAAPGRAGYNSALSRLKGTKKKFCSWQQRNPRRRPPRPPRRPSSRPRRRPPPRSRSPRRPSPKKPAAKKPRREEGRRPRRPPPRSRVGQEARRARRLVAKKPRRQASAAAKKAGAAKPAVAKKPAAKPRQAGAAKKPRRQAAPASKPPADAKPRRVSAAGAGKSDAARRRRLRPPSPSQPSRSAAQAGQQVVARPPLRTGRLATPRPQRPIGKVAVAVAASQPAPAPQGQGEGRAVQDRRQPLVVRSSRTATSRRRTRNT